MAYRKNISVRRLVNHVQIARNFRREAAHCVAPDIVITALPTVELAYEAVRYARAIRIPALVDIRDLWPDILVDAAPRAVRPFGRLGLSYMFAQARSALVG